MCQKSERKRRKRARRTSIARATLAGEIVFPPCVLKLMGGISSQGSNWGLNGVFSEAVIHNASALRVTIGRRARAGVNGLTEAEGFAPLIAVRKDGM